VNPSDRDLVEQVYRSLIDAISDGRLGPGTRMTQGSLAERFQVSRQPVLQALRLLKRDGLVVDAPAMTAGRKRGQGLMVAPLDPATLMHTYEIRGALETLAVRRACERASQQTRARLQDRIAIGRRAVLSGDVTAMMDADWSFHEAIYRASGNPFILEAAALHWCHARRAMGAVLQQSKIRDSVWDEHAAIADAVHSANADLAVQLMLNHTSQASQFIVARLKSPAKTLAP
jgi:DNA-binding GntR family transcriptional regulator